MSNDKVDKIKASSASDILGKITDNLKHGIDTEIEVDNTAKEKNITETLKEAQSAKLFKNVIGSMIFITILILIGAFITAGHDIYMLATTNISYFNMCGIIFITFIYLLKLCLAVIACILIIMIAIIIISAVYSTITKFVHFLLNFIKAKKELSKANSDKKKAEESSKKE